MMRIVTRVRDDDHGAGYLATFIVLFSVLVVAGVGILIDSARIFAADRQCTSIAFEAARAGANALDADAIRDGLIEVGRGDGQRLPPRLRRRRSCPRRAPRCSR